MRTSYEDTVMPDCGPTTAGLAWTLSNGAEAGPVGSGVVPVAAGRVSLKPATVRESSRDVTVLADVDVLVCGGGPAGTAAAAAAAAAGSRTLLVERYGFLGGMATAGLVVPHFDAHANRGINAEMIANLTERGGWGAEFWKISFDPELWKHVSEDLVLKSGSDLLYHTFAVAALMDDGRICGVVVETKSGRFAVLAKVVVDCTGDGDVAARAGAAFEKGRPEDGLMQPMTMMFRLGGVKWVQKSGRQLRSLIEEAIQRTGHHYRLAFENPWAIHLPNPGEVAVQLVHVRNVDGTDVRDLTRAEIDGRRQTLAVVDFMRTHVPEFADAHLIETAPQIGVRETRRILGDYVLTGDDVVQGRSFDDAIATVSFPMDVHEPNNAGQSGLKAVGGGRGAYDIPYRCLLPRGIEQLIVAGRCISGTFEAHASYRVKGPCMAMGQAAGTAASLAAQGDVTARHVSISELHRELGKQGFRLWGSRRVDGISPSLSAEASYSPPRSGARRLSVYRGPG